jgi:Glycosyl hydrolases family 2, sugar binding domain/Glycosyl hydrolases family 2, TIM barrel domain/Glycosyl hydrolases family 2
MVPPPPRRALLPAILAAVSLQVTLAASAPQTARLPLEGTWRFRLDRSNAGIEERWFERALPDRIKLPGSLPAQGIGDDISVETKWTGDIVDKSWFTAPEYAAYRKPGNIKVPFWLQPEKYYVGAAWYQRDIELPPDWTGKRVLLTLERPHWETRVWVDGKPLGSNNNLSTPHEYDLGTHLPPGKHRLTIRVDNSLVVDVGVNSHCVTDHTQGNWNGIVGNIELCCDPPPWVASDGLVTFDDLQVFPSLSRKSARVRMHVVNRTGQPVKVDICLDLAPGNNITSAPAFPQQRMEALIAPEGATVETECNPGDVVYPWDEFSPSLYRLSARLDGRFGGRLQIDTRSTTFGLREISTDGTQFLLNGRKTFFRGTLECCIFPLTGHPPTDVASWKRIIRIAKAHGLNLFRFHSYCPPEAAFVAADELGFYYQVETCWANQSISLGDGKPVDQWVYDETDRILKADGNHPSFLLMPYGNEPGGNQASAYLAKWVDHYKAQDPRRLWTSGSGWPLISENQFHVTPDPRIQHWGAGLNSRINARPPETRTDYRDFVQRQKVPVISHEIGEWCVYPNFDEMPKYRGYLKPKNFEIFRDTLRAHHMGDLAHRFLLASGKLQTLCYKEDIESALRTPGMGGFELLDLHDFPGQGTALVGVLDPFWDDKGYVTAKEFNRFCNATVPLARLTKRVFTANESLEAELEVAHFGPAPMEDVAATWSLVADDGHAVARGQLPPRHIPIDNGTVLGSMRMDLKDVPSPARYRLVVTLQPASGPTGSGSRGRRDARSTFENDWDVWVYPAKVDSQPPPDVMVAADLNEQALAALNAGGKVLLLVPPARVKGDKLGKVALGFSSIFWNTAWTGRQAPTTLGILCDPKHPALADFPTDFHSNWQWWYLVSQAGAMILDDLPKGLRPTVQVIDDWVTARKLGLVFEARMGAGKLLVCSIDLNKDLEHNPVARQMLHSLLHYMAGPKFKPTITLALAEVQNLLSFPP